MQASAFLVVTLYAGTLWLPGLLLGWLAGLRGWTLAAAAPLLCYALAGVAGPALAAADVRWTPTSALVLLVAVAGVLATVSWAFQRSGRAAEARVGVLDRLGAVLHRWPGRAVAVADDEPDWTRRAHLAVAAALVPIAGLGAAVIWIGLGQLSAVPQDWDAAFHANGIRWIADTGDGSLVGMGRVNWFEDDFQVFYPNAYHLLGALVLRLTGVDVPTVLNAQTVLLPGMGALVIVALVHRFGGRTVLAVAAAACAVAVTAFYDMLWRGPLLTFATGAALMPLAAVLVVDLADARGWRSRLRAGSLFAAMLVGLICLNPAVLFSAVLFVLPALVQQWAQRPGPGRLRMAARESAVIVLAGLGAALLAMPQLLGALASAGGEPVDWPADLSWRRAVFELLTLSHDGVNPVPPHPAARPEWALAAAGLLGLIWLGRLGRLRWLVAVGAAFGGLFLLAASSDADWVNTLTRPWWNDRWRFIGLCVVPIAVVAGHGLVELHRRVTNRLAVRPGLGTRLGRRPALLSAVLVAALFLASSEGLYAGQNINRMRLMAPDGPVVTEQEVAAMRVLAAVVPPGQRVLNDRNDGSAWMYAIAGVLPVAGHYNATRIGPDASLLAARFNHYPDDPRVRAAVERLGVSYVMVGRGFVHDFRRQPGFVALDRAPWLERIYQNRDAVIYRIRPEPPEQP